MITIYPVDTWQRESYSLVACSTHTCCTLSFPHCTLRTLCISSSCRSLNTFPRFVIFSKRDETINPIVSVLFKDYCVIIVNCHYDNNPTHWHTSTYFKGNCICRALHKVVLYIVTSLYSFGSLKVYDRHLTIIFSDTVNSSCNF